MHTKRGEKKERQVAVRLDPETSGMLDVLCERWGHKAASVVRRCIRAAYRVEVFADMGGTPIPAKRRPKNARGPAKKL